MVELNWAGQISEAHHSKVVNRLVSLLSEQCKSLITKQDPARSPWVSQFSRRVNRIHFILELMEQNLPDVSPVCQSFAGLNKVCEQVVQNKYRSITQQSIDSEQNSLLNSSLMSTGMEFKSVTSSVAHYSKLPQKLKKTEQPVRKANVLPVKSPVKLYQSTGARKKQRNLSTEISEGKTDPKFLKTAQPWIDPATTNKSVNRSQASEQRKRYGSIAFGGSQIMKDDQ